MGDAPSLEQAIVLMNAESDARKPFDEQRDVLPKIIPVQPDQRIARMIGPVRRGGHFPAMEVPDLPAICAAAHAKGALVAIDNTWSAGLALRADKVIE